MVCGVARRSVPIVTETIRRKANHSTPRRPLKPFGHFLPERLRGIRRGKATDETLKEETLEGTIKGGSAIVIGSTATHDERAAAIDGFVEDINDRWRKGFRYCGRLRLTVSERTVVNRRPNEPSAFLYLYEIAHSLQIDRG
jgi:hypothetical protein